MNDVILHIRWHVGEHQIDAVAPIHTTETPKYVGVNPWITINYFLFMIRILGESDATACVTEAKHTWKGTLTCKREFRPLPRK